MADMTFDTKLGVGGLALGVVSMGLSLITTFYSSYQAIDPTLKVIINWVMFIAGIILIIIGAYLIILLIRRSRASSKPQAIVDSLKNG